MQRLSYPAETVLSNKIASNRIVPSFKYSPGKPLGRRPSLFLSLLLSHPLFSKSLSQFPNIPGQPPASMHVLLHAAWYFTIIKLGGAGARFGDYLCGDCANLLLISGRNLFSNTKFPYLIPKFQSQTIITSGLTATAKRLEASNQNCNCI